MSTIGGRTSYPEDLLRKQRAKLEMKTKYPMPAAEPAMDPRTYPPTASYVMPPRDGPPPVPVVPRGTTAGPSPAAGPVTVPQPTLHDTVPGQGDVAFSPGDVDSQKKKLLRDHSRIIQRALTTTDPAEREALIQERYRTEDDIHALSGVAQQQYADPVSSRVRIRDQYRRALDTQSPAEASAPQMDPELAAGTQMAPVGLQQPGSTPESEMSRQQMLRLKAREPIVTGTGMGMGVSSPAEEEAKRQRLRASAAIPNRATPEEAFPDATPEDQARQKKSIAEGRTRQEAAIPAATEAMGRYKRNEMFQRDMGTKAQELTRTNADAAIADANRRKLGEDAGTLEAKFKLQAANRAYQAGTPVPTSGGDMEEAVSRVEHDIPTITNAAKFPFFWKANGPADTALTDLEAKAPLLSLEQRAAFSKRLRGVADQINSQGWTTLGAEGYFNRIRKLIASLEVGYTQPH